jgi:hypothetical protein
MPRKEEVNFEDRIRGWVSFNTINHLDAPAYKDWVTFT